MALDDVIARAQSQANAQNKPVNQYEKQLQLFPINDQTHLSHHLNYLFRTDSQQKWTNQFTDGNVYISIDENRVIHLDAADSKEKREEMKARARAEIRKRAKARGVNAESFAKELKMSRLDYLDNAVFSFTERVKADTVELLQSICSSGFGLDLIYAVVHIDQTRNYVHLHLLFCDRT